MSYAGIKPGTNLVRPPPTCAASFPDLVHDNDPLQVRFGATPWSSVQSYVGFKLDNVVMKRYFTSRLVLVNYYLVTGNLFLKVAKEKSEILNKYMVEQTLDMFLLKGNL